jgi:hypothetical protein
MAKSIGARDAEWIMQQEKKHLISRKVAFEFDWDVKAPALFLLKSRCILTGPRFQARGYSPDVGVGNAKEYLGAFGRTQEWDLPTQLSSGGLGSPKMCNRGVVLRAA